MVEYDGGLQHGVRLQERKNGNVQAFLIADRAGFA
jgi:hypothetical protein